ncbi:MULTISPECIES: extracellular solute-binding protein [unclassified Paenibacillus]|uniref:extracellular solute-binding protein n=1 Tax=unclassified Paenibacillus TaxID=185978 RepID=UPI002404CFD2|nr:MULTISPECIES: extracellular solute-binding protein [unclassified Paenibacillus]MDF9839520.1 putative aldouronate transport system substrate-binding protein [Paenibacillus sp. PastF-2]MDF9846101.1 putative aldouronate transport system substrate-binding protein [Paenibacillus sp. PastM-2]MDF9852674.1 putative aldouronate transport system substrate-binding protein [Paenibacillus sp. PastF-1]MDH6477595.1 putative aldouronate transport system substrate-binding protein [Paenibacillus sp. PastH-2]
MELQKKARVGVILTLFAGLLSACSGNTENGASQNASGSEENQLTVVNGKIEPEVTFTLIRGTDAATSFKNGESIEDNVHIKWAKETLGVNIRTLWSAGQDSYDTKLKLMLSANEKMSDVVVVNSASTAKMLIESGKVMSIDESFEKYASDTWKTAMADAPDAWLPYRSEGKTYAFPILSKPDDSTPVLWIRKDWLDKLGLQAPKTLDELEQVVDAFTNDDPDGNGVKDTYGIDLAIKNGFASKPLEPIGNPSWFFGMFGTVAGQWNLEEDGTVAYGSIQPGTKEALLTLKEWKDKGYLAEDISLHDYAKVTENIVAGKVGIIAMPAWYLAYPGSMLLQNNPDADYEPYPIPSGPDGKAARQGTALTSGGIMLNKDISSESLQGFFHYMNYLYQGADSDNPLLFQGFQEGYDYAVIDGQIDPDQSKIPGGYVGTGKYTILSNTLPLIPSKYLELYSKIGTGSELNAQETAFMGTQGIDAKQPTTIMQGKALNVVNEQRDITKVNTFIGAATETMTTRQDFLDKMELETFSSIIYGKNSIDEFDAFVDKWKKSGGEQITQEVNDWYNSVK